LLVLSFVKEKQEKILIETFHDVPIAFNIKVLDQETWRSIEEYCMKYRLMVLLPRSRWETKEIDKIMSLLTQLRNPRQIRLLLSPLDDGIWDRDHVSKLQNRQKHSHSSVTLFQRYDDIKQRKTQLGILCTLLKYLCCLHRCNTTLFQFSKRAEVELGNLGRLEEETFSQIKKLPKPSSS
jgi:hypothetical protein